MYTNLEPSYISEDVAHFLHRCSLLCIRPRQQNQGFSKDRNWLLLIQPKSVCFPNWVLQIKTNCVTALLLTTSVSCARYGLETSSTAMISNFFNFLMTVLCIWRKYCLVQFGVSILAYGIKQNQEICILNIVWKSLSHHNTKQSMYLMPRQRSFSRIHPWRSII